MKKSFLSFLLLMLTCSTLFAQKQDDHNFTVAKNMEIFNAIYRNLDMMYVDTLDANQVIGNGINKMLQSLDPYTVYYPEDKTKELKQMMTGKYAGIGALIRYNMQIKNSVIDEPYEGTPAAKAGLKKGDVILSIDDSTMVGKDNAYVSNHLRGEAGTTFLLKIRRPSSGKILQKKITRENIQLPSLPYYGLQDNQIGYINLNSFTENCSKEVRKAFIEMKGQGMKGLVFDLRNNGGGSELEAANIVNMFVPKGITVVSNRGKMKRGNRDYKTMVEPLDTVMPVVVLVNGETASASEITSGALQDLDRAVILGTRTYGKGLVQLPIDLPYNTQMKLTTSQYYIPSGRCIQAVDYKHGNGGYVEHIPDSLTKVFHTLHGREVRDGGGIMPDVECKPDSLPNIIYYLSASGQDSTEVMFNWVSNYIANHETIAPAASFMITDADYEDFKQKVVASGFKYDPESEKVMSTLKKVMQFEGYFEEAKEEFERLEKKLTHNVGHDLDLHKELIKQLLSSEIVAAYYYQKGVIQNSLLSDKQVKEAYRLLLDNEEYNRILTPKQ
ncbi:MAG: S41 family peptidase [Prevotella sp.]|nr:S41 family peptidase [Prevotella sp.]